MRFSYRDISFDDLRGDLVTDYLVAVEADLQIVDGERTVYEEPSFPVVELARALQAWSGAPVRDDFVFDSLSSDVPGLVTVAREGDLWVVFSATEPASRSAPLPAPEIDACVRQFIDEVAAELRDRGIDPGRVLGD